MNTLRDAQARRIADFVRAARRIAVLTGAGVSTPSGIPDFRSPAGLYADGRNANVFDLPAFRRDPAPFYRFAREFYPMIKRAQPNPAHLVLAAWERAGKSVEIATQNIDDLHQRAGSTRVYPVHGTTLTSTCQGCGRSGPTAALEPKVLAGEVPTCACGGVWKPDITFFGEMLPQDAWEHSERAMSEADLVLVLGTSLVVYPAASLPDARRGTARLVVVNQDPTHLDPEADVVVHARVEEVLQAAEGFRQG